MDKETISTENTVVQSISNKETYEIEEVNLKIKNHLDKITDSFDFIKVNNNISFKQFIDKEKYHFKIDLTLDLDDKGLKSIPDIIKNVKFPINFDIDVSKTTVQYVDYMLDQMFDELSTYCEGIKLQLEEFKKNSNKGVIKHGKVSYST